RRESGMAAAGSGGWKIGWNSDAGDWNVTLGTAGRSAELLKPNGSVTTSGRTTPVDRSAAGSPSRASVAAAPGSAGSSPWASSAGPIRRAVATSSTAAVITLGTAWPDRVLLLIRRRLVGE